MADAHESTRTGVAAARSTTRRQFLASSAGAFAGLTLLGSHRAFAADGGRQPNVLMIAVDDLKPMLGCYGQAQVQSPNIDRLAAAGTRFDRAYCQVAVCGASRASLLTGMRPTRNRFLTYKTYAEQDAPDALSLPGHLKRHGYTCISLGKISHHRDDNADDWSEHPWGAGGNWRGYGSGRRGNGPSVEAVEAPTDAYPDGRIADRAIQTLDQLKGQPFFLAAGFMKPHLPFACPKRYWDLYDRDAIEPVGVTEVKHGVPEPALHNFGELRDYTDIPNNRKPLSDDKARELIHGYYACVSFIDAQVGRVLDHLDQLGLAENTIVVLWGDHGWHLGDHGLWCKHSNFEHATHVPLIVRGPGVGAGQHTDALSEFVDLYPTLSEMVGLQRPGHLEGTSFVPLLSNPKRAWKSAAFSQYRRRDVLGRSIRTDRYRMTRWDRADGTIVGDELYDHAQDPEELVNLAPLEAHAQTLNSMADRLQRGWAAAKPDAT